MLNSLLVVHIDGICNKKYTQNPPAAYVMPSAAS